MAAALDFRFPEPPAPGETLEVAEGVLWVRLPLPFRLDHVNIYLIEDGVGFALLDTGIDNASTRALWERLLGGLLKGRPLTRIRDRDDKVAPWRGKPELFAQFRKAAAPKFRGFQAPEYAIRGVEAAVNLPFEEGIA